MKRSFGLFALAMVLGLAVVSPGRAEPTRTPPPSSGPASLVVGTSPPELDARRVSGPDDVRLAALRGRVVVLDFWATWCGPCRAIMPELDRLQGQFHAQGLSVVGVAQESESEILTHLVRERVSYTIARDTGHTMRDYGVRAIPMLVVIDRRGHVARVFTGVSSSDLVDLEALVQMLIRQPP